MGALAVGVQAASAGPLVFGQVLAGIGSGTVNQFTPTGTLTGTLSTGRSNTYDTGMCFDSLHNLYGTDFDGGATKWDSNGNLLMSMWGTGFNANPESCSVDASDNIYVGQADGSGDVLKFDTSGNLLNTYSPATEDRGTDWIDLAADQHTLFYTSEGSSVKRFDVASNTQLSDFANGLSGPCYALRIRANGEVLVACTSLVYRLNSSGGVIQTYTPGGSLLFALNLDPDGTSFWTADLSSGQIWRIDIATGVVITTFTSNLNTALGGLAVVGELRAATDTTPPTCSLVATIPGPPKAIQVEVQDTGSGLASIGHSETNAVTVVPPFAPGDTSPVVVTSTKSNQSLASTLQLTVTDEAGNTTVCDPVVPGSLLRAHARHQRLLRLRHLHLAKVRW